MSGPNGYHNCTQITTIINRETTVPRKIGLPHNKHFEWHLKNTVFVYHLSFKWLELCTQPRKSLSWNPDWPWRLVFPWCTELTTEVLCRSLKKPIWIVCEGISFTAKPNPWLRFKPEDYTSISQNEHTHTQNKKKAWKNSTVCSPLFSLHYSRLGTVLWYLS